MVLGANHEQRVASGGVLDVAERLQGFGEASRQALEAIQMDTRLSPLAFIGTPRCDWRFGSKSVMSGLEAYF